MSNQELREVWRALFRTEQLDEQQWVIWEKLHSVDTIREGILQLAVKHRKMAGTMTLDHMVRFASAVMNRLTKEKQDAIAKLKSVPVTVPDVEDDNRWNR
jgi:hypothetical protein